MQYRNGQILDIKVVEPIRTETREHRITNKPETDYVKRLKELVEEREHCIENPNRITMRCSLTKEVIEYLELKGAVTRLRMVRDLGLTSQAASKIIGLLVNKGVIKTCRRSYLILIFKRRPSAWTTDD